MVFRTIGIYVITSKFFYVFTFFKIQKIVTFYVFCRVSYVFSNYDSCQHLHYEAKKLHPCWFCNNLIKLRSRMSVFTARCTLVQSAVLRSHVVCLSVCPSVRPSVRPSVTLLNCDHIGWNSSKIISPLVSLGCSLFATAKHDGSAPRGTPPNLSAK